MSLGKTLNATSLLVVVGGRSAVEAQSVYKCVFALVNETVKHLGPSRQVEKCCTSVRHLVLV